MSREVMGSFTCLGSTVEGANVGEVLQNLWGTPGTPCEMVDELWDVLGNLGELLGNV